MHLKKNNQIEKKKKGGLFFLIFGMALFFGSCAPKKAAPPPLPPLKIRPAEQALRIIQSCQDAKEDLENTPGSAEEKIQDILVSKSLNRTKKESLCVYFGLLENKEALKSLQQISQAVWENNTASHSAKRIFSQENYGFVTSVAFESFQATCKKPPINQGSVQEKPGFKVQVATTGQQGKVLFVAMHIQNYNPLKKNIFFQAPNLSWKNSKLAYDAMDPFPTNDSWADFQFCETKSYNFQFLLGENVQASHYFFNIKINDQLFVFPLSDAKERF